MIVTKLLLLINSGWNIYVLSNYSLVTMMHGILEYVCVDLLILFQDYGVINYI